MCAKKLISFDVFDTAIFRKVYKPTDIFDLVENRVGGNFKKHRLEAQDLARKEVKHYKLTDIYKHLPQFDKKVELEVEAENVYANKEILDIYNSGKYDCVFISDMYLSSYQIANLLIKCGYKNPKVFSSSTCGCGKGDGSLYDHVQSVLKRKISRHYGDNYKSDIIKAQEKGIPETIYKPNLENQKKVTPELEDSRVYKLQVINELSDKPLGEKIGYMWGVPVYEFTKWCLNTAKKGQTIFFNARDGYLPYLISKNIIKTDKDIKYCHFSRRSTVLPLVDTSKHLNHSDNIKQFNILRYGRANILKDFLKAHRLDKYDLTSVYDKLGITEKENMSIRPFVCDQKLFEEFILEIEPYIYEVFTKDREELLKYAKSLNLKNGDLFVDIGYNGTMQSALEQLLGIKLKGMYFQALKGHCNIICNNIEKNSFLPDDFLRGHTGLTEVVFSEPAGGVIRYEDGKPVLFGDSKTRVDVTLQILKGCLTCALELHRSNLDASLNDCLSLMKRYFYKPTIEECKYLNQPLFENGNENIMESVVWFDEERIKQGGLRECYNRSYWREAFIKLLKANDELAYLENQLVPPNILDLLTKTKVKQLMEKFRNYSKPFYFYGCSALANEIMKRFYWIRKNKNFKGFIDQQYDKIKTFNGCPVFPLKEVIRKQPDCEIYLTVMFNDLVRGQLGEQPVPILDLY